MAWNIVTLLGMPAVLIFVKLRVPLMSWSLVLLGATAWLVIVSAMLYTVSSFAIWAEDKRRSRTHCPSCGHPFRRPGALWCYGCKGLTKDGYGAIASWMVAFTIVLWFWHVSGRFVG